MITKYLFEQLLKIKRYTVDDSEVNKFTITID